MVLKALLIGAAIQFFVVPAIGALSDKVGRRPLYLIGAVGVGVWTFVFFDLVDTEEPNKILLAVVVGLILHSFMYAPQAAFFSELFGTIGPLHRCLGGLPAGLDLRRCAGADHRAEAAR